MSGILPDTTVTSATRFNNNIAAFNYGATALDKCNCDAYVAWINAQLCDNYLPNSNQPSLLHCQQQRPPIFLASATVPVKDLSRDLRNGVVLARLAEKLSGEHLEKVHPHPVTRQQMLTNVDEVLKLALRWRVKMHPVLSTEIVDGDTRATLRLVLALAAHFRPGSVIRQIGGVAKTPPSTQRVITFSTSDSPVSPTTVSPSLMTCQDPQRLFSAKLLKFKAVRSPRTAISTSSFTSPSTEQLSNVSNNRPSSTQFEDENDDDSREDSQVSSPLSHEAQAGSNTTTSICSLESSNNAKPPIIPEQDFNGLQNEIASAKKTLLSLQQMLFDQDCNFNDNSIADGAPVSAINNGNGNNQKAVTGHAHDTSAVLQLRAQIRDMNLTLEELAVEKRQLECRLIDRDRQLTDMLASLNERDRLISHLQAKVHDLIASGRREVAELKELAVAVASPTNETAFLSPFENGKKHFVHFNNNNYSPGSGGDLTVEDGPAVPVGKSTRIYYSTNDGAGPYCLCIPKPLESLCLRDIRQSFGRFGRKYHIRFIPLHELERRRGVVKAVGQYGGKCGLDFSLATLELRNEDDQIPGLENQVYCRIEEII